MNQAEPAKGHLHKDEGLKGDSIHDFSTHLKSEPEEEDAVRKLPDYLLVGGILILSFLLIGIIHLLRPGQILDTLNSLVPALALAYVLVGLAVSVAGAFIRSKKLMAKIGFLLFISAGILIIIAAAFQFILRIALS